jgi:hypothetical protein
MKFSTWLNALTAKASPSGAADYVAIYDAAAGDSKKVLLNDLPSSGSGGVGDHGCKVYNDAAQTISNDTHTNLTFNSEEYDTDEYHSTVTNTDRITIPAGQAGKYLIGATFVWASNTSGRRMLNLRKNGAGIAGLGVPQAGAMNRMAITHLEDLSEGDYLECRVYQDSGGNLATNLDFFNPTFWAQKIT